MRIFNLDRPRAAAALLVAVVLTIMTGASATHRAAASEVPIPGSPTPSRTSSCPIPPSRTTGSPFPPRRDRRAQRRGHQHHREAACGGTRIGHSRGQIGGRPDLGRPDLGCLRRIPRRRCPRSAPARHCDREVRIGIAVADGEVSMTGNVDSWPEWPPRRIYCRQCARRPLRHQRDRGRHG